MSAVTYRMIVAAAENGVIGHKGEIPWYIKADFRHFADLTRGHPCIMGRTTFDSIIARNGKPLPHRKTIVVSRALTPEDLSVYEDVILANSIDEARNLAEKEAGKISVDTVYVCGGAEIYRQSFNFTDCIDLTEVHMKPEGDAFFTLPDQQNWINVSRETFAPEGDVPGYSFVTLKRA